MKKYKFYALKPNDIKPNKRYLICIDENTFEKYVVQFEEQTVVDLYNINITHCEGLKIIMNVDGTWFYPLELRFKKYRLLQLKEYSNLLNHFKNEEWTAYTNIHNQDIIKIDKVLNICDTCCLELENHIMSNNCEPYYTNIPDLTFNKDNVFINIFDLHAMDYKMIKTIVNKDYKTIFNSKTIFSCTNMLKEMSK